MFKTLLITALLTLSLNATGAEQCTDIYVLEAFGDNMVEVATGESIEVLEEIEKDYAEHGYL